VRIRGDDHPLKRDAEGFWRGSARAAVGDYYSYVVDRRSWPDPCSFHQPEGVGGKSSVFGSPRVEQLGLGLDDLVLYELHIGTFSDEGTFDGAIPHLRPLAELGVTAVEVMPIATFPGRRGWGYDGLYTYAPHEAYGGPDGFARFVEAAHEVGLGVVLDVVYNHVGPGNEALSAFGPYFTDRYKTFWGAALDYSQHGVREWAIQNAEHWVRDYGVDGLRVDAVHAVFDDAAQARHVLAELADRVRALAPRTVVIAEIETGDLRPIEEWGYDAQWADELHHHLHVLLTGERDGYYAAYGSVEGLARELCRVPAERFVVCSQNHDQVGNRALGDRPARDELGLRAALVLFAPQIPLLFQGEEYGEGRPFRYFTDHIDPAVAEATREGRRREFAGFAGFRGEVPDPQAEETFLASKLDRSSFDSDLHGLYRRLLALRRKLPDEVEAEYDGERLTLRRGRFGLDVDFATRSLRFSE
jgi:maltooligosyltrehalose trehalohydrolase